MKLTVVGGGNIGEPFAQACLRSGLASREHLTIIEISPARRAELEKRLACRVQNAPDKEVKASDAVILAVKPQDSTECLRALAPYLQGGELFISFVAGLKLATVEALTRPDLVLVRAMPNLPVKVDLGMTIYCVENLAAAKAPKEAERLVDTILSSCGQTLRVADEALLDSGTAVSGTGPAYVFYLIEHLLSAAKDLGFTEAEATKIVAQTMTGSVKLWLESKLSPTELRKAVTTPGGTTAAAFSEFDRGRLGEILQAGIKQAHKRCVELGS